MGTSLRLFLFPDIILIYILEVNPPHHSTFACQIRVAAERERDPFHEKRIQLIYKEPVAVLEENFEIRDPEIQQ